MRIIFTLIFFAAALGSCKNDNMEALHPKKNCDTADVVISFANDIEPIFIKSCGASNGACHIDNQTNAQYGLGNYNDVSATIADNKLISSITWDGTVTPMPYALPKLDDCTINTIIAWVNRGAPDN